MIIACEGERVRSPVQKDARCPNFDIKGLFYRKKPKEGIHIEVSCGCLQPSGSQTLCKNTVPCFHVKNTLKVSTFAPECCTELFSRGIIHLPYYFLLFLLCFSLFLSTYCLFSLFLSSCLFFPLSVFPDALSRSLRAADRSTTGT